MKYLENWNTEFGKSLSFMELNSNGLTEGDAHGFFCVLGSLWTLGLS